MCARRIGTLPKPRLHKRGYQRIRVDGRDFTLGKPGTQQADERYKAILAAWAEGGGSLLDDFKFDSKPKKRKPLKTRQHAPDPNQILCGRFVVCGIREREGKIMALIFIAVCCGLFTYTPTDSQPS